MWWRAVVYDSPGSCRASERAYDQQGQASKCRRRPATPQRHTHAVALTMATKPSTNFRPTHLELARIGVICEASAPGCPPQQSARRPRRRHQMLLDAAPAPGAQSDQLSAAQKRSARSGLAEVVTFGYISWLRPTPAKRLSLGAPSCSRCPSHSCAITDNLCACVSMNRQFRKRK